MDVVLFFSFLWLYPSKSFFGLHLVLFFSQKLVGKKSSQKKVEHLIHFPDCGAAAEK
jgi:hypothetical protein